MCLDCFEIYCWAGDSGFGAKTNSGYGGRVVNGFLAAVMSSLLVLIVLMT
jgi:hypothetical protein